MLTLGLFTDVHYAAGVREGTRHCHLGVAKLRVALGAFAAARVDAVVGLGDLVDSADTLAEEAGYLQSVCAQLSGVRVPVRLTPGNHCLWTLTRDVYQQITRPVTGQAATWGSLDLKGWHLIFLDGCFRGDGVPYGGRNNDWTDALVSDEQVRWLRADLTAGRTPSLVFIHQRLDVTPPFGVANAEAVRAILEGSGRARAVFQGHEHGGAETVIKGIRYITLPAIVEGDDVQQAAFAIAMASPSGEVSLRPYPTPSAAIAAPDSREPR